MKFVWPESIQGLGQQAGKLNLKIELYFCGLNLKYAKLVTDRQATGVHLQENRYGEDRRQGGGQTDRRQIDRRQVYILRFCAGERGRGAARDPLAKQLPTPIA